MKQVTGDPTPLVSIGVPAYNDERYLTQTLESLLAQDYENLEIIVCDNASPDGTQEICRNFEKRDKRLRYFRHSENVGALRNFNLLFQLSKGEFFMWSGAHDLWDKDFVSKGVRELKKEPQTVLVAGEYHEIDEDGTYRKQIPVHVDTRSMNPAQRLHWVIHELGCCFAIYSLKRAEALRKTSLIQDKIGSDQIFLAQLSLLGAFSSIDAKSYVRAFPHRKITEKENVARLIPASLAKTRNAWIMERFPACQRTFELSKIIYRSGLPFSIRFRFILELLNRWKTSLVSEFTVKSIPHGMRQWLKRAIGNLKSVGDCP
jgi:glycosyltransferase involved in cell wall biosynthesis